MAWSKTPLLPQLHVLSSLAALAAALYSTPTAPASVFIGVFSRRDSAPQRSLVRDMWRNAAKSKSLDAEYRFVLCEGTDDDLEGQLELEHQIHEDLLVLQCQEGDTQGRLTWKLLTLLNAYQNNFGQYTMFMKVDDDSFVAWGRLSEALQTLPNFGMDHYVGMEGPTATVCRNPSHRSYEPYFAFKGDEYPPYMHGGAGFLLGKTLISQLMAEGIPGRRILWNEERAVGVWMYALESAGHKYQTLKLPGAYRGAAVLPSLLQQNATSSARQGSSPGAGAWATWQDYPYTLHHGLKAETIACLAVASEESRLSGSVSHCFEYEAGGIGGEDEGSTDCHNERVLVDTDRGRLSIIQ